MAHKKTTIKDVALAAGVSTQTISRVLNNRPDVSNRTRNHVLRIIAQLNYSPNILARRLRRENDKPALAIEFNGFSCVSVDEKQKTIESALANNVLSQEKARWLLQELEQGFMTDGQFVQLPIVPYASQGK